VDRDATDPVAALDHTDALAELGRLDRGALAARARADDEQIEIHGAVGAAAGIGLGRHRGGRGFVLRRIVGHALPGEIAVPGGSRVSVSF
jgi:hypothetical protein